jgi:hypothetical protein
MNYRSRNFPFLSTIVLSVLAGMILTGCCTCNNGVNRSEDDSQRTRRSTIAPGRCIVIATVVDVENHEPGDSNTIPGTIRVDSVVGYGSSYGSGYSPGEELLVQFHMSEQDSFKSDLKAGAQIRAELKRSLSRGERVPATHVQSYSMVNK